MTEREFYNHLAQRYSHDNYACPSARYESCHDREYEWWEPVCEDYAKFFKENKNMNLDETRILVDGLAYRPHDISLDSDLDGIKITVSAYLDPRNRGSYLFRKEPTNSTNPTITNVIFNPPATIVFWSDHTKTVVKCDTSKEKYDPEKGLAMAISRKMLGDNKREYYNTFLHWLKKYDKQPEEETTTVTVEVDGQEFSRTVTEAVVKEARRSARKSNRGMI